MSWTVTSVWLSIASLIFLTVAGSVSGPCRNLQKTQEVRTKIPTYLETLPISWKFPKQLHNVILQLTMHY